MERRFHEELKKLKNKLLEMSFAVEEAIRKSCEALANRDEKMAQEVIQGDKGIDRMEIDIDEKGHSLFAIGQPMASDLRLVIMILKINTDLERMGDHAVNIAEKCQHILKDPPIRGGVNLDFMMRAVQDMMRAALDAFLREDVALAQDVLVRDDEIDRDHVKHYAELREMMEKNPEAVRAGMNLMMVSHNLERIADLAGNIAEDVIYWKEGREVRHRALGEK